MDPLDELEAVKEAERLSSFAKQWGIGAEARR